MIPPMLDIWRMCPPPCARMIGSAARVTAPNTLVPNCARNSPSVSSSTMPNRP